MNEPLISVIIPAYNYGQYIKQALDSIISQTYKSWEILVIDDGSTDNTGEIVKQVMETDQRISYYKVKNAGPSAARNTALSYAKGEFIQFLDADDLIQERKFEIQLNIFREIPHADVVYGSVRYFTKNAFDKEGWLFTYWGPDKEWMPKLTGYGLEILPGALKGNFSHISSLLFKRNLIDKVGLFDVDKRAAEDYQFLLRCTMMDAFFYYHDTPGSYSLVRWHPDNVSRNVEWMRAGERKMRQDLAPLLENIKNAEAIRNNNNAIKALSFMLGKSWKKKFLSGGSLDFLKKGLRALGLERIAQKIFYK